MEFAQNRDSFENNIPDRPGVDQQTWYLKVIIEQE